MTSRFQILCDGEEIGTSALEERDSAMGTATGVFAPSPAYARVKAIFRLFSDAQSETGPHDQAKLERYYRERDRLDLSVITPDGAHLPTSVVHIADFAGEDGDDACEVEVHIDDPAFFAQLLKTEERGGGT